MLKFIRNNRFFLSIFLVLILALSIQIGLFSLNSAPINFLHKVFNVFVIRVSDFSHYIVMQKKYIFDNYTDPNSYISLDIPADLEKNITPNVVPSDLKPDSGHLITETNFVVPDIQKTISVPISPVSQESFSYVPGLIIKTDNASSTVIDSFVNDKLDILKYTNNERNSNFLGSLSPSSDLDIIANLRIEDLFSNQYFEHESPAGNSAPDLAEKIGYKYLIIGENLALGNFSGGEEIVSAWMESPGHKANILNERYKELGVAVKEGLFKGENMIMAVQIFALPEAFCSKPSPDTKLLIDSMAVSIKAMQIDAQLTYENLNITKDDPDVDKSYYNQKVQEYNYFAKKVNDAIISLKGIIDYYNIEVAKYNSCISS